MSHFFKAILWAGLGFLPGRFWAPVLMFDTPGLEAIVSMKYIAPRWTVKITFLTQVPTQEA